MGVGPAEATPANAASGGGGQHDAALAFDPGDYTTISITIDGVPSVVRWYKEICYVADPVLMAASQPLPPFAYPNPAEPNPCGFQSMNIYVPESAFDDADTAIYLGFVNSGWFASYVRASVADGASFDSATSNVGAARRPGTCTPTWARVRARSSAPTALGPARPPLPSLTRRRQCGTCD